MQSYFLRRLAGLPLAALAVSVLAFSLMHLMPGEPARLIARGRLGEQVTAAEVERIRHEQGLDRSVPVQYLWWLGRLVRGDLGRSVQSGRPVREELAARWPHTLMLAGAALAISVVAGIPVGVLCGARQGSLADAAGASLGILGVSIPGFWLALLLILIFGLWLGWFPSYGGRGLVSLVLPAVTLGAGMAALTLRVTRSRMAAVMRREFIRMARARGLGEWAVVGRHALKNALIPVVTVLGLQFGRLLEGAVIVETIFGRPGIGRLLVEAIFARDFPVVQGCVLTIAAAFVGANLLVDLLYSWLDPRIHYGGES